MKAHFLNNDFACQLVRYIPTDGPKEEKTGEAHASDGHDATLDVEEKPDLLKVIIDEEISQFLDDSF